MVSTSTRSFPPGIDVPSLTWLRKDANQELDWDLQKQHLEFLIKSGLDGGMCTLLKHGPVRPPPQHRGREADVRRNRQGGARVRATYDPAQFCALAGQSDWLVPALSVGSTGVTTGVANLYPKVCNNIYDLFKAGKVKGAEAAQIELAKMEWGFGKGASTARSGWWPRSWVILRIAGTSGGRIPSSGMRRSRSGYQKWSSP
ncbi:hypothetical protein diail_11561 [Diaporthe ilicicola]|nr:hypothetical protein diail_11561 [Diaporthe ilicicola]